MKGMFLLILMNSLCCSFTISMILGCWILLVTVRMTFFHSPPSSLCKHAQFCSQAQCFCKAFYLSVRLPKAKSNWIVALTFASSLGFSKKASLS